ncbi:hypothetical protein HK101_007821 [Irineochytrium annulatum]|nr:hypothetical protein HK101_007821 [Irineochytrium annulatum]
MDSQQQLLFFGALPVLLVVFNAIPRSWALLTYLIGYGLVAMTIQLALYAAGPRISRKDPNGVGRATDMTEPSTIAIPMRCYSYGCSTQPASALPCYSPTCPRRANAAFSAAAATSASPKVPVPSIRIPFPPPSQIRRRRPSVVTRLLTTGLFTVSVPPTNVLGLIHLDRDQPVPTSSELHALLRMRVIDRFERFRSLLTTSPILKGVSHALPVFTPLPADLIDIDGLISTHDVDDEGDISRVVEKHLNHFWDPALPLWRVHLVRAAKGRSAIAFDIHHAIGDGLSLVQVALACITDSTGAPLPPVPDMKKRQHASPLAGLTLSNAPERIRAASTLAAAFAVAMWKNITDALWTADDATCVKAPHLRHEWSSRRHVVTAPTISLAAVKAIKNKYGATVNDVVMAALGGAYRHYLQEVKDPVLAARQRTVEATGDETADLEALEASTLAKPELLFRAVMPYSRARAPASSDPSGPLHNAFSTVSCALPVGVAGRPSNRVRAFRKAMDALKTTPEPFAQSLVQRIGEALLGHEGLGRVTLQYTARHTIAVTNVPGPQERAYFCGKKVASINAVVSNASAMWAVFSYAGGVFVNCNLDERLYEKPERIVELFVEELDAMRVEAGVEEPLLL